MDEASKARERAQFDRATTEHYGGDVRKQIAQVLSIWAAVSGDGSYGEQCRIMAAEVLKLRPAGGVKRNDE